MWSSTFLHVALAISIGFLLSCTSYVDAHGRLTLPTTRDQVAGVYEYQMNAPTGYSTDFVCRGFPKGSSVATITAGSTFSFSYTLTALHPGDCFLYISYDVDADPSVQQWFKIAEIAYCQLYSGQTLSATMPSWVKSGSAVLRWEWYALQQVTNTEFYAQCSDITIVGNANGCVGTPLVTVPGNLPADNANLLNYRLAYEPNAPFFFTGPAVATSTCGTGSGSSSGSTQTTAPAAKLTTAPVVKSTSSPPRVTSPPPGNMITTAPPVSNQQPVEYCSTTAPQQQPATTAAKVTTAPASTTSSKTTTKPTTAATTKPTTAAVKTSAPKVVPTTAAASQSSSNGQCEVLQDDEYQPLDNQNPAQFEEKASSSSSSSSFSSDTIMVAAFIAGCIGLFAGVGVGFAIQAIVNRKKNQELPTAKSVELTEGFIAIS